MSQTAPASVPPSFVEEVVLEGHIIDSLLLPKVLDESLTRGGSYFLRDIRVGQSQTDTSFAKIAIQAPTAETLRDILDAIHDHGAVPASAQECRVVPADMDSAFPEGFYSTTNF